MVGSCVIVEAARYSSDSVDFIVMVWRLVIVTDGKVDVLTIVNEFRNLAYLPFSNIQIAVA